MKKVLLSPEGPLLREVLSSSIQVANKNMSAIFESETATGSEAGMGTKKGKRGTYKKYSPEEKASVQFYVDRACFQFPWHVKELTIHWSSYRSIHVVSSNARVKFT